MALHFGEKPYTVHCTYVHDTTLGRSPRKLLNHSIASRLLDDLLASDSFPMRHTAPDLLAVRLEYDDWGRPRLKIGECMSMAVSFSHIFDTIWAALSRPGNQLGIDVARADEFKGNYPLHRAFHPEELCTPMFDGLSIQESAAMLWSVKEAVVKAMGMGFGLLGPLDIRIESLADCTTHYSVQVSIPYTSLQRVGLLSSPCMDIISFSHGGAWASVAIQPCNEWPCVLSDEGPVHPAPSSDRSFTRMISGSS